MAELITIARPYAQAAFAAAKETQSIADWSAQLQKLAAIAQDASFLAFEKSSNATTEKLLDVIVGAMGSDLMNPVYNLLKVMAENKRLSALTEVADIFGQLQAEDEKRVRATVISAQATTVEQQSKLSAALNAKFHADVEVTYEQDPSLLAGIKIKVGDWVVDGSAQTQLNKLGAAIAQ